MDWMRRKLLVAGGTIILAATLAGSAWAGNAMHLVVNGRMIQPDVEPQMVQGRVVAPVRALAEALGASVAWEGATDTVRVDLPEVASLEQRVAMLEQAVAPRTAEEAAEAYLRAMQSKNGAWQFALLAPELREQYRADMESSLWRIGASSRQIDAYTIRPGTELDNGRWRFVADYTVRVPPDTGLP
ncbi:MAG: stalk domain-containing protein [Syntrophothermus sp.]